MSYEEKELGGLPPEQIVRLGANYRRDTCTNLDEYGISFAEEVTDTSLQYMLRMLEQRTKRCVLQYKWGGGDGHRSALVRSVCRLH
jgi:hypothetical protein